MGEVASSMFIFSSAFAGGLRRPKRFFLPGKIRARRSRAQREYVAPILLNRQPIGQRPIGKMKTDIQRELRSKTCAIRVFRASLTALVSSRSDIPVCLSSIPHSLTSNVTRFARPRT